MNRMNRMNKSKSSQDFSEYQLLLDHPAPDMIKSKSATRLNEGTFETEYRTIPKTPSSKSNKAKLNQRGAKQRVAKGSKVKGRKTIEFEGDGPLGIYFIDNENGARVRSISEDTVASEYIELEEEMIVTKIEKYDCKYMSYSDIMGIIGVRWRKYSRVNIEFEYEVTDEVTDKVTDEVTTCSVYIFLERNNCSEFYDDFVDLGVRDREDFKYIEYQDLVNMKMPTVQRRSLHMTLKFDKKVMTKSPSLVFSDIDDPFQGLENDDV